MPDYARGLDLREDCLPLRAGERQARTRRWTPAVDGESWLSEQFGESQRCDL